LKDLDTLFSSGFLHNDINSENVICGRDGENFELFLVDWDDTVIGTSLQNSETIKLINKDKSNMFVMILKKCGTWDKACSDRSDGNIYEGNHVEIQKIAEQALKDNIINGKSLDTAKSLIYWHLNGEKTIVADYSTNPLQIFRYLDIKENTPHLMKLLEPLLGKP